MTAMGLRKYPRTPHLESSRLQVGDDTHHVPFAELAGAYVVAEEKIDGANAAVSFGDDGELLLQSRGHYLVGGGREKHFARLKSWATCHARALHAVLGARYVMYGEWVFARHTIFYDRLPHLFLEFDVLDREREVFLDTAARRALLAELPVVSVPVVFAGTPTSLDALWELVRQPLWQSDHWAETLRALAEAQGLDPERVLLESDRSGLSEGLYLKVERDGVVERRLKLVRSSFLQTVMQSGTHWLARPIIPNQLADGVDLYDPTRTLLTPGVPL